MNEKKEKVFLSEQVITDLYSKGILKRNYALPGSFIIDVDKVIVCKKHEPIVLELKEAKMVTLKDTTSAWIQEWRELFPKGKNQNTGLLYRGDKQTCLKNMIKFRKEHDFTKEEIFEITTRAIEEAEKVNYEYFPAAHYFINKQNTGSRLAQLGELFREGGDDARRGARTAI